MTSSIEKSPPAVTSFNSAIVALDRVSKILKTTDSENKPLNKITKAFEAAKKSVDGIDLSKISDIRAAPIGEAPDNVKKLAKKVDDFAETIIQKKAVVIAALPPVKKPMTADDLKSCLGTKGDVDINRAALTQYYKSIGTDPKKIEEKVQKSLDAIANLSATSGSVEIAADCYVSIDTSVEPEKKAEASTGKITGITVKRMSPGALPGSSEVSSASKIAGNEFVPKDVLQAFKALKDLEESIERLKKSLENLREPSSAVEPLGPRIIHIAGDGNCLFRSVASAMYLQGPKGSDREETQVKGGDYKRFRTQACNFIESIIDVRDEVIEASSEGSTDVSGPPKKVFAVKDAKKETDVILDSQITNDQLLGALNADLGIENESNREKQTVETYLGALKSDGFYAGAAALMALAITNKVAIKVIPVGSLASNFGRDSSGKPIREGNQVVTKEEIYNGGNDRPVITLAYNGGHYNVVDTFDSKS